MLTPKIPTLCREVCAELRSTWKVQTASQSLLASASHGVLLALPHVHAARGQPGWNEGPGSLFSGSCIVLFPCNWPGRTLDNPSGPAIWGLQTEGFSKAALLATPFSLLGLCHGSGQHTPWHEPQLPCSALHQPWRGWGGENRSRRKRSYGSSPVFWQIFMNKEFSIHCLLLVFSRAIFAQFCRFMVFFGWEVICQLFNSVIIIYIFS